MVCAILSHFCRKKFSSKTMNADLVVQTEFQLKNVYDSWQKNQSSHCINRRISLIYFELKHNNS